MTVRTIGEFYSLLLICLLSYSVSMPNERTIVRTQMIILPFVEVAAKKPEHLVFKELSTQVLEEIIHKESRGNTKAKGDKHLRDFALGIVQLRMCAIRDVNKTYGTHYTSHDRLDSLKSVEIYHLYLGKGIKLFTRKYNKLPTPIQVKAMWNGGIYGGYRNAKALRYAKR
tara:strand:+ start:6196 stop:6705 length:510 start_codon:yes stop_codon:yes gene_type:complete